MLPNEIESDMRTHKSELLLLKDNQEHHHNQASNSQASETYIDFSKMLKKKSSLIDFKKVKQTFSFSKKVQQSYKNSESDSSSSEESANDDDDYEHGLQYPHHEHDFEKEFEEDHRIDVAEMKEEQTLASELVALANDIHRTFSGGEVISQDDNAFTSTPLPFHAFEDDAKSPSASLFNYNDDLKEIIDDDHCLLPEFDWAALEAKLKESSHNEAQSKSNNERDEIRRKLASMATSDNENDDYIPDYLKSTNTKALIGQNLQICFMNESISDDGDEESAHDAQSQCSSEHLDPQRSPQLKDKRLNKQFQSSSEIFRQLLAASPDPESPSHLLVNKHIKLQRETKNSLINAQKQAKAQIEQEQKAKKPSPIADIVGLATYGLKRLDKRMLSHMNIGQLQVIVNDLCNQIENTNEELTGLLVRRDDLYMQQDSMLVDIEDITMRLQEYCEKLNRMDKSEIVAHKKAPEVAPAQASSYRTKLMQIGSITKSKLYNFARKTN